MSGACEYQPYRKHKEIPEKQEDKKIELLRLAGLAVVTIFVAWMNLLQPIWLANIVVVITVIVCGYSLYKESFSALKKGRVNMELSMVIAIIASLGLYQFLPAAVITLFALLSEFVEGFIIGKGRKNIQILYDLAPRKAIIKRRKIKDDNEIQAITMQEVSVEEVKVGDTIIAREGDIIPVDGQVIRGISTVNQSSITGESSPIEKGIGDYVFAGTTNLTNLLEIKCEKLSTDSTFAKIIHLVEQAESSKAPIQKLSDKLATRLIQFAIGLSALTFIVTQDIVSTLSVIVVAGACGLAVGTPIALLATNSKLAKKGIIVKGGLQIENLRNTGTLIFDKTGTITAGKPIVSQVISFDLNIEPKKVLEFAAIAEENINHPLARAIQERRLEEKIDLHSTTNTLTIDKKNNDNRVSVMVGKGVTVTSQYGQRISVGNMRFMKELLSATHSADNNLLNFNLRTLSFSNDQVLSNDQVYRRLMKSHSRNLSSVEGTEVIESKTNKKTNNDLLFNSATTTFVSLNGKIIGCLLFEDKLRDEARTALSKIKSMGIDIVMLTGDNEYIAKRIAAEAGIDKLYANLLPEDKVSKIEEIVEEQKKQKNKKTVIMVGDGINDAPALAKADVGIAMGKTGTDIAIETADVVLMTEDLGKIPYLLKTSRQSMSAIQQNFFGTLFVDGLGFVLAIIGLINPLLAAIIHVGSELIFIANSSRIIIDN